MKMKNSALVELSQNLRAVSNLQGKSFSYAIVRNLKRVQSALAPAQEILKPTEHFQKYENERLALCHQYSEKVNGQPRIENQNFIIVPEKKEEFEKAIQHLKEENKSAINIMDEKLKEYQLAMDEEVEFNPYMMQMEDVPETISPAQLNGIIDLIEEK